MPLAPKITPRTTFDKLVYAPEGIALFTSAGLAEVILTPPLKAHLPLGAIMTGRIRASAPAPAHITKGKSSPKQHFYFAQLPLGHEGFLPSAAPLTLGAKVTVEVIKEAYGRKAAKLALTGSNKDSSLPSNQEALQFLSTPDILNEILAKYEVKSIISSDISLRTRAEQAAAEGKPFPVLTLVPSASTPEKASLFTTEGVSDALAEAVLPSFITPEGIRIFIEKTEAFWAIDVDSSASPLTNFTKINMAAAKAIAARLRLLNLTGQIVIDFISTGAHRLAPEVVSYMKDALASDSTTAFVAGVSPLGHLEIIRQGQRAPVPELFAKLETI